jgi:hypothetical protein
MKTFFLKTIILFVFGGLILNYSPCFSQKIFSCESKYDAKIKVFVVDSKYDADLLVYKVDSKYDVTQNEGLWFFTDSKYDADKLIYFVDSKYDADLLVYFVDSKYDAKWEKMSKKYLLY